MTTRATKARDRYQPVLTLPKLPYDQFMALRDNIALNGVLVPILTDGGRPVCRIIDGGTRKAIADELGYDCPEVVQEGLTEEEMRTLARALNLARRQLTAEQKRQLIADQLLETPDRSNRWVGKQLGVSHPTVASVRAEMEATGKVFQFDRTLGADGKSRPAARGVVGADALDAGESGLTPVEQAILRAATKIRQRQNAERIKRQQAQERAARSKVGRPHWTITADQTVVDCHLGLFDPPYGITQESWEPEDLESFTRGWGGRWSKCGADFLAIFWSQATLFEGRKWFDESLTGYGFQQLLVWHANNNVAPKSRRWFKQSWEPIFLYRRKGSSRPIVSNNKRWDVERHNLDCHVAAVPQTNYAGHDLKQHPTQKPVSVMRWLIHALTEPGERVASVFCGVSPCGVAALQLGRTYHGVEVNAGYRRVAEARLAAYG
jgi:ParB-like chromosome segregation protein Spo0J